MKFGLLGPDLSVVRADKTTLCNVQGNWNTVEKIIMNVDETFIKWWFIDNFVILSPQKTNFKIVLRVDA